jgi:1-deoxy-D-xylulose 5-phosphate reductoisomerase
VACRFLEIPAVIETTLEELGSEPVYGFESLYESDRRSRELAAETVAALR